MCIYFEVGVGCQCAPFSLGFGALYIFTLEIWALLYVCSNFPLAAGTEGTGKGAKLLHSSDGLSGILIFRAGCLFGGSSTCVHRAQPNNSFYLKYQAFRRIIPCFAQHSPKVQSNGPARVQASLSAVFTPIHWTGFSLRH